MSRKWPCKSTAWNCSTTSWISTVWSICCVTFCIWWCIACTTIWTSCLLFLCCRFTSCLLSSCLIFALFFSRCNSLFLCTDFCFQFIRSSLIMCYQIFIILKFLLLWCWKISKLSLVTLLLCLYCLKILFLSYKSTLCRSYFLFSLLHLIKHISVILW